MRTRSTNAQDALRIIAGCPNGVTADALHAQGIRPATLRRLVAQRKITAAQERIARPPISVTRYRLVQP